MKKIISLFLLCLSLWAKSPLDINGYDHQIVFWSFNYQFTEALELVDKKIAENPGIPKYYFLKVVTLSLKHLADSDKYNYEKRYEFRKEKNLELIEYTEAVLEKFEGIEMTPENKFYIANLHGYLGRMYGFDDSYMSAFSNAKEGKDMLEELVEEYPALYDAYLLLGMFEYYADRLGGVTEFIASILGFSGDRSTGIKYLKLAHQKGELTKPFAEFILGETYSIQESNNFDAAGYFSLLARKYPNNKSFYEWYTRILLQLNRLKDVEKLIENDEKGHLSNFFKALFYVRNNEHQIAVDLFTAAIEEKDFKWRIAYSYSKYLRGISALLIDNPIPNIESELDKEQLEVYNEIKNNLIAAKAVYDFAAKVGRLDVGVEMVIPKIENLPKDGYLRSMYEFYSGVYFYRYRDATRAILFFNKVAKDREHFRSAAAEYLINIYKLIKPTDEQIAHLEDVIDDLDDEDLEFSFMDLRG